MSPELVVGIASGVGFASGIALEELAINRVARNFKGFLEANQLALERAPTERVSLPQRLGRAIIAPLALTTAIAGGLEAYANYAPNLKPVTQPDLVLAVDHSGATDKLLGSKPLVESIDSFAQLVAGNKRSSTAFVAGSNTVKTVPVAELPKNQPFGDAPLHQALQNALDQANRNTQPIKGQTTITPNSIVFITNGNLPTSGAPLIDQANRQGTPVNVINVEQLDKLDKRTLIGLQQLAKRTHGTYWNANENNLKNISRAVQTEFQTPPAQRAPIPHRLLLNLLAAATVVSVGRQFISRSNNTTGRRPKGE